MANGKPGAPIGNRNAEREKVWRDALRKALMQYEDDDVKRGHALRAIAEGVIKRAIAGDKDACKELGDRLDGKPMQSTELSTPEDRELRIRVVA